MGEVGGWGSGSGGENHVHASLLDGEAQASQMSVVKDFRANGRLCHCHKSSQSCGVNVHWFPNKLSLYVAPIGAFFVPACPPLTAINDHFCV